MSLKKLNCRRGFTLIEVLIVLVIISILSAIALMNYTGLLGKVRDSTRRSYLGELVTTLEVNKTPDGFQSLQSDQISALNSFDSKGNAYCIASNLVPDPAFSVPWEGTCPDGFEVVGPGVPEDTFSAFKVCAYLEEPGEGQQNVFCKSSSI